RSHQGRTTPERASPSRRRRQRLLPRSAGLEKEVKRPRVRARLRNLNGPISPICPIPSRIGARYQAARMDWALARERLGAELIGAREEVATRWRLALREQGAFAWALDRCASELVLQAGAALSDATPGEAPWRRCGGLLRIDARDQGHSLA